MPGWQKAGLALLASIAFHLSAAYLLGLAAKLPQPRPNKPVTVSVVEVTKPKPPEPPPPPPPVKPKPPPPPQPVVHVLKPPPTKEPPTPPPPSNPPPPDAKPSATPPVVLPGVTLESTSEKGGFSVNTGNTLYGDPGTKGHDASEVKPYKAARFVAAARVSEQARVLNLESIDIRKYYPVEAKKNEFEGDVVLRVGIDSDGTVYKLSVVTDPGQGLGDAAMQVMRKEFKWAPAKMDGEPVATTLTFTMHFTINN